MSVLELVLCWYVVLVQCRRVLAVQALTEEGCRQGVRERVDQLVVLESRMDDWLMLESIRNDWLMLDSIRDDWLRLHQ